MTHSHCPADLAPEVLVKLEEPSLLVPGDEVRTFLRARMSEAQINAEIDAICDLAERRSAFGSYGLLDLKPMELAYGCIYSGESLLGWMHEHERKRLQQLKTALPSPGELAEAARLRIQARIAARKARRRPALGSDTAEVQRAYVGPQMALSG
ncbi:TPA: hypothetical protein ACKQHR_001589 [Pseudomonas aeruginosa]|nr:hypothetical protein [Pseudomonas aeruginosa]